MHFFKQNRRCISWFAALAILLNALAPTISHTWSRMHNQPAPWNVICSTYGNQFSTLTVLQTAQSSQDKDQKDNSRPLPMEHCPYCTSHAHGLAPLADSGIRLAALNLSYSLPPLFYLAPRQLFVWAAANPRAPPALA